MPSTENLLARLDAINGAASSWALLTQVRELVQSALNNGVDGRLLIARYADSLNRDLVFAVADAAIPEGPHGIEPALDLLHRLRLRYDGWILTPLLSALGTGDWDGGWRPPPAYFPLLRHCLSYPYTRPRSHLLMHSLNAVAAICAGNNAVVLPDAQRAWLLQRLQSLNPLRVDYDYVRSHRDAAWQGLSAIGDSVFSAALEPLDSAAHSDPGAESEGRLREWMETFAIDGDRLWLLVERYGSVPSLTIIRGLAAALSGWGADWRAEEGGGLAPPLYSFLGMIRDRDDVVTLGRCTQALRRQTELGRPWDIPAQPPPTLYPFLMQCLRAALVNPAITENDFRRELLLLLESLSGQGFLDELVPPVQRAQIHEGVRRLRSAVSGSRAPRPADREMFAAESALASLDTLARRCDVLGRTADPAVRVDERDEALDLVDVCTQRAADFWMLLERYGSSPAEPILFALAQMLMEKEGVLGPNLLQCIERLAAGLVCEPDTWALSGSLMALQQQARARELTWEPRLLVSLLLRCLRQPDRFVLDAWVSLLAALDQQGTLDAALPLDEFGAIYTQLLRVLPRRVGTATVRRGDALWRLLWWGLLCSSQDGRRRIREFAGASEGDLADAERRLGRTLPLSYREFLKLTDGWQQPASSRFGVLRPAQQIRPFASANPDWFSRCLVDGFFLDVPDREYFAYGRQQDPTKIRCAYLETAIQISAWGRTAVCLLNPQTVTADGEWEAWILERDAPRGRRYRTFWDLIRQQ